jgi:glycosyltransferase involved in cell wall biosynthesis
MPRILIVRGHLVTPWELRPWMELPERFDVSYLSTRSNGFDASSLDLRPVPVGTLRDRFPKGMVGEVATGLLRDRYTTRADAAYADADVVHAEELSFWFAADAARRKQRHGFKLVQTVWETLPFLETYRSSGAARFRREVLDATDLFLAATDRARMGLLLEGVDEERIVVAYPGIDAARFAAAAQAGAAPTEHTIVAPGRLEWQKGHHDVLRAVALLHRGVVMRADGSCVAPRLRIVGKGPEEGRLRAYAAELGLAGSVEFGSVPYEDMPTVFASASCLLLGSQSSATGGYHPFDVPRLFWEEQFGLVFAEAMAAGLDIIATSSGAIPEVLDGQGTLVPAGDYIGMARALAAGPLSRPPGERVAYPGELVARYSTAAAAQRLADAYDRVLGGAATSARR